MGTHRVLAESVSGGQLAVFPFTGLVPQQLKPASTPLIDGDGEQCLADEIKQSADCVDRQQDAEDQQNRPRLLVEVLQVKQSYPKQFLGGGVVGDEVYGERGLRDPVDGAAVEGDAVEQQKHTEADHDDGQSPRSGDEDAHIMSHQRQRCGCDGVEKEESESDAGQQPYLFGGERLHIPLVRGDEDEHVDEAENVVG